MTTALIYDERFLEHKTGRGHPERPDRLRAIMEGLETAGLLSKLSRPGFGKADLELIQRLHTPGYVQHCFEDCRNKLPFIDTPDSAVCPESADIAQLAVGGVVEAVDLVMAGKIDNAFCAVRPPGHHAETGLSMGFCLFSNIALAAEHLIHHHGLDRVAIVDFDVHHCNGTQHLLEYRPDILVVSLHQEPLTLFPNTGYINEYGKGEGKGYTLNVPFAPGCGDEQYMEAFDSMVMPKLDEFKPQFLLISAGFDAAIEDELAEIDLTTDCFDWMSRRLVDAAKRYCGGRLVSVLEGGYALDALSRGVVAHVNALLEA
jgi:acetoin utilization deacetylase AcuC-like enzyme